jgi:hypothetical protein
VWEWVVSPHGDEFFFLEAASLAAQLLEQVKTLRCRFGWNEDSQTTHCCSGGAVLTSWPFSLFEQSLEQHFCALYLLNVNAFPHQAHTPLAVLCR